MTIKGSSDSPARRRRRNNGSFYFMGVFCGFRRKRRRQLTVRQQCAPLLQGVETERGCTRGRAHGHGERRREDVRLLLPRSFTGSCSAQGEGVAREVVARVGRRSRRRVRDVPASSSSDGEVVLSASRCHCCSLPAWKPIIIRIFCKASASAMVAAVRPAG